MSKRKIDNIALAIAVLSSPEFIAKARRWFPRDWQQRICRFDVIAAAADRPPQTVESTCTRACAKVKRKLELQGITKTEALMCLEMLAKQGCYKDCSPPRSPTRFS